ncbi:MAG: hypothetical protein OXH63_09950 [Gemmatimonadetes bacterium]|nr:hypothetical protein [Gemmatimonadota bacterium]
MSKSGDWIPPEDRPTVEVVNSTYQPSKAELEEAIELPRGLTPDQVGQALMRQVNVRKIPRPR